MRDILLNKLPKDFDIATDAHPEQVKRLFRNCLLIGRRFRLAHLRFKTEVIEVTTFRAGNNSEKSPHRIVTRRGMVLRDNIYGTTLTEDVWRRDFTVNALYYNGQDRTVIDYCGGLNDLKQKCIRLIGDPVSRYQEDPVRLLRAIRFAAKLDFQIEMATEKALIKSRFLLREISNARLFEETLKLFHGGCAVGTYQLLIRYQILEQLFPHISKGFYQDSIQMNWLLTACRQADTRVLSEKTVSPAFLFAVFLWSPLQREVKKYIKKGEPEDDDVSLSVRYHQAARHVLTVQHQRTLLPRFCSQTIKDIWLLQPELEQRFPTHIADLLYHPRFRAAYDFLLLRAQCHEVPESLAAWWTTFLESDTATRERLLSLYADKKKRFKKEKEG